MGRHPTRRNATNIRIRNVEKATQRLTDIRAACGPEPFPISIPDSVARVPSCRALGAVELTVQCLRVKVFDKSFYFYFAKPFKSFVEM